MPCHENESCTPFGCACHPSTRADDAQKPVDPLPALLARVEHNLTLRHVYPHEESRAEIAGLVARLRALSGAVPDSYFQDLAEKAQALPDAMRVQPNRGAVPTISEEMVADVIRAAITEFNNGVVPYDDLVNRHAQRFLLQLAARPVAGVPPEQGDAKRG